MNFRFSCLILCALSLTTFSRICASDPGDQDETFFETEIRPLLVNHCYQCHSTKASTLHGELLLDSEDGLLKGGERGAAIVPGDVDNSLLIKAVRYDEDEGLEMPPSRRLSDREIRMLEIWVSRGAHFPKNSKPLQVESPSDPEAGKDHWAYRPLQEVSIPSLTDPGLGQTPIDRFVRARLKQEGISSVLPADRTTLLRRLNFVLTGLPLDPERTVGSSNTADDHDYEHEVDRLLASAEFGRRWGRHWLDLARYADSNGLDENFLFREAWRYRNWVIDAVNDDMPYDEFLRLQLAGDLLPFETIRQRDQQRIAAGFLVVGPKVLLGINPDLQRMDVADEQIDTIGKVVLGQTLGCARCHDHKFDPIPTSDYYALAGIFSSTSVMERRHMLGQQRVMERLVGLGEKGADADGEYERYWREHKDLKSRAQKANQHLTALKRAGQLAFNDLSPEHDGFVAEAASNLSLPLEERIAAQKRLVAKLAQQLAKPPAIPPRGMIPVDRDQVVDEEIRIAGQFDDKGATVPRGFLTVLVDRAPAIPEASSGRLELADWLTDTQGRSGQLAARVMANRIWYHVMGRGLVRTVDNFGRTGESPTHPELLDYLATRLIQSNWSVKSLVREIVMSQTFQLSSQHQAVAHETDPENRLIWRAHRRKLDPESLRDAILHIAGQLDFGKVDSTVNYLGDQATAVGANKVRRRTDYSCRSVYLPVIRNDLPEVFEIFDFADPHVATGMRPDTTVPMQGLFMLNDSMIMDASRALAERIGNATPTGDDPSKVELLFQLAVGVSPNSHEREALLTFLEQAREIVRQEQETSSQNEEKQELRSEAVLELDAFALVCHAVYASSRFQFLR